MVNLTERLYRVLKKHPTLRTKDALASQLGCSRSMLYHYEQGNPEPPAQLLSKLLKIEMVLGLINSTSVESPGNGNPKTFGVSSHADPNVTKRIRVIGWAHAGQAGSYEEIAESWQESIPTDCRDPKAFAVVLEGDSMEKVYYDGDILTLMPNQEAHSGCLAVCRFVDDGVLFRRIELMGEQIRLMPFNERYEASTHNRKDFAWIYPVWETRRFVWK